MKLLDKLKNTFFEEEYVEVEEKPKAVAKKVEVKEKKKDFIKRKEEIKEEVHEKEEEKVVEDNYETPTINYSDNEITKQDSPLPYFDDEDFIDNELINEDFNEPTLETKKIYGESVDKLYSSINYDEDKPNNQPYGAPIKGAFKPTPIISPIYGILDKNYKKEEVVDKQITDNYVARQNIDLDSIRNKAYGKLEQENIKESEIDETTEEEIVNNELLYDMTSDSNKPIVDKVTIADAEEYFEDLGLEYNIDYKDSRYEKATGRRRSTKDEEKEEIVDYEEDANLEDNLFDVIDSMYDDEDKEGEE